MSHNLERATNLLTEYHDALIRLDELLLSLNGMLQQANAEQAYDGVTGTTFESLKYITRRMFEVIPQSIKETRHYNEPATTS